MKILLVEDNDLSMKIMDLNLRKHGFETITKSSPIGALEYLDSDPDIQLIITDIMMPEMDGLTFIEKLNDNPDLQKIPVIVCSARSDSATVRTAIQRGAVDYITKPINAALVLKKVRSALNILEPPIQ